MRFNLERERTDNVKEFFIKKIKRRLQIDSFVALEKVSFTINKGEVFGLIGDNGCGKSTTLKIISGIITPTVGQVEVLGSISPLIELGAGFDIELTAKENILLNGLTLGYSKKFIESKQQEIIDFSELKDFMDVPLKNYSSGMIARLGFSIATLVKPDILIVDEILSVGDMGFQEKCENRIQELMAGGTTVLIVSHSIKQIEKLCNRVLWLDHGHMVALGKTEEICDCYKRKDFKGMNDNEIT
ncbi:MAG: ABC transporter ATP-binding protein [Paenibacillaceae bacterium]|nr:ABC transporter ATP-binding protein [Paenibacillaceae bacterium]